MQQFTFELRRSRFFSLPFLATVLMITYFFALAIIVMRAVLTPIGLGWYLTYAIVTTTTVVANLRRHQFNSISITRAQLTYPMRFLFGHRSATQSLRRISTVEYKDGKSPKLIIGLSGLTPCVIREKDLIAGSVSDVHRSLLIMVQAGDHAEEIMHRIVHAEQIRKDQRKPPYASIGLALSMLAIYLWANLQMPGNDIGERILAAGALICTGNPGIDWYRILSSVFLHATVPFLIADIAIILVIGLRIERLIGAATYLLVFIGGALVGNAVTIWLAADPVVVGASGGIFALFGLYAVILRKYRDRLPSTVQFLSSRWFAACLLFMLIPPNGRISGITHILGLLSGVVISWWALVDSGGRRQRLVNVLGGALVSLSLAAIAIAVYEAPGWTRQKSRLENALLSMTRPTRNGITLAVGLLQDGGDASPWQLGRATSLLKSLPDKSDDEWRSLASMQLEQGHLGRSILAARQSLVAAAAPRYSISYWLGAIMHLPNLRIQQDASFLVGAELRFRSLHKRPFGSDGSCGIDTMFAVDGTLRAAPTRQSQGECEVDLLRKRPNGDRTLVIFDSPPARAPGSPAHTVGQGANWTLLAVFPGRKGQDIPSVIRVND